MRRLLSLHFFTLNLTKNENCKHYDWQEYDRNCKPISLQFSFSVKFIVTKIITFTVIGHFRSCYKVIFGHLYSVMLTILICSFASAYSLFTFVLLFVSQQFLKWLLPASIRKYSKIYKKYFIIMPTIGSCRRMMKKTTPRPVFGSNRQMLTNTLNIVNSPTYAIVFSQLVSYRLFQRE